VTDVEKNLICPSVPDLSRNRRAVWRKQCACEETSRFTRLLLVAYFKSLAYVYKIVLEIVACFRTRTYKQPRQRNGKL
jgi:hypothetical protein